MKLQFVRAKDRVFLVFLVVLVVFKFSQFFERRLCGLVHKLRNVSPGLGHRNAGSVRILVSFAWISCVIAIILSGMRLSHLVCVLFEVAPDFVGCSVPLILARHLSSLHVDLVLVRLVVLRTAIAHFSEIDDIASSFVF